MDPTFGWVRGFLALAYLRMEMFEEANAEIIDYTEGDPTVPLDPAMVVSDPDVSESITVTLTLANTATGALTSNDGASYTAGTGVWTITGSVSAVNTALANSAFSHRASPAKTRGGYCESCASTAPSAAASG